MAGGSRPSIAILGSRGIPARYGGFETFAEEISIALASRGMSVTVFCEGKGEAPLSDYKGVAVRYLPRLRLGPIAPIVSDAYGLWCAGGSYDVVYVLGYASPMFFWVPRLFGSSVWVNMDGIEWARSKWGWVGKRYLRTAEALAVRLADRVIADSQGIKNFLQRRHQRMAPCTVIGYGAPVVDHPPDVRLLEGWNLEPYSYYLSVCRLEPENHVLELIDGFARTDSRHQFAIVGDSRGTRKYVRRLRQARAPRVRFLGSVYEVEKLQALRYYALAYLHGHSVGGTNPSLLEALGCGNVVVAHDNEFNREVCGDVAFYFGTANEVAGAIAAIEALKPAARSTFGERARAIVRARYRWEDVADMYVSLLRAGDLPRRR